MKLVTILLATLLVGCSTTVPVKTKFPEAPKELMEKCADLEEVKDETVLSEVSKVIVRNYTKYHQCSIKNSGWIEWYEKQKKLFEAVK